MKPRAVMFVIIIWLGGSTGFGRPFTYQAAQSAPKSNPGYSISVASPSEPPHLGSPINFVITVTVGSKSGYWKAQRGDAAYRAFRFVLERDGRETETTVFHRRITARERPEDPPGNVDGSSIVSTVAPGTSLAFTIDLTKLYEITEPGTYTLDVSRVEDDNKTIVRAKPVTFTVNPK
jgi:hypothetical protein